LHAYLVGVQTSVQCDFDAFLWGAWGLYLQRCLRVKAPDTWFFTWMQQLLAECLSLARHLLTYLPSGREALDKALTSGAAALKRVQELEAELQQLRASSSVMSLFQLPSKQDVLAGGLCGGLACLFWLSLWHRGLMVAAPSRIADTHHFLMQAARVYH
jgi:hypothetical protein